MNRPEAYSILAGILEQHRISGFAALRDRAGTSASEDIVAPSGVCYTVTINVDWSDTDRRALVIRGRIDDQNTFRFDPLEESIKIANPQYVRDPKMA